MRDFKSDYSTTQTDVLDGAIRTASQFFKDNLIARYDAVAALFGANDSLTALLDDWRASGADFSNVEIVSAIEMGSADAAYAEEIDTIFVSDALLDGSSSSARLVDVLLEELGHRIDARVNAVDSRGDEGEAFVALMRGEIDITEYTAQDDFALLQLDEFGAVAVEQTVTISDSGGFEGSSETITLETLNGGEITYSYTHYTIPDRFIIRYEGKNLFDTGFTGGSRSGTIELPAGSSDTLNVIVATDDAGTAWNYSVTVEPSDCEDVMPWVITSLGDDFEHNDTNDLCENTGGITIGRSDGAGVLIRAEGGKATYNQDTLTVTGATVFAGIGNEARSLYNGDFTMNLNTGKATVKETSTGTYKMASLDVEFKSMSLLSDVVGFDIEYKMPDELTALPITTTDFLDSALRFSSNGAYPIAGFKINPPGNQQFDLLGLVDVSASSTSLEYRAQDDAIRFQSKVKFENTAWLKDYAKSLEVDLAGTAAKPNYIEVNSDGDFTAVGSAKAALGIGPIAGFSLSEMEVTFDTTSREIGGSVTIGTPFGNSFGKKLNPDEGGASAKISVEFVTDPFELDKVGIDVSGLNRPIPAYPLLFWNSIGGSVDNFAPSQTKPLTLAGSVGITLGPELGGVSLAKSTGTITANKEMIEGKLVTDFLPVKGSILGKDFGPVSLMNNDSTATLDWSKGFMQFVGTTKVLDGFFTSSATLKADSSFNFSAIGNTAVAIPDFVPWTGGTKLGSANSAIIFVNDGANNNDFVAGWGSKTISTPWKAYDITLGLRVNFDGTANVIGGDNIPKTSSWFITGGREYVMLNALWENADPDARVFVVKPDGTVIQEADFAANRIMVVEDFSSPTERVVIIDAPEEGTWDLEVVDPTGLGEVTYAASGETESPTFVFGPTAVIQTDGDVEYSFTLDTPASAVSISFFYDDDLTELDGVFAGNLAAGAGTGTFVWDPTGVVPDDYFVYAVVDDGVNPITIAETAFSVNVGSEADISISIEADVEEAKAGDTIRYTVTATNNSATDIAKAITALINLADLAPLETSSIAASTTDLADHAFDLGDIAAGATTSFTIDVEVDAAAVAADQLAADAYVLSGTYDSESGNDSAVSGVLVVEEQTVDEVSLQVTSSIASLTDLTAGEDFSYSVVIKNVGTTAATNITLEEVISNTDGITFDKPATFNGTSYDLDLGDLAADEQVTVVVSGTAIAAGTIRTTSTVRSDGFDIVLSDNQTVDAAPVAGALPEEADLSVTASVEAGSADANRLLKIDINNAGPGVASDVEVKVTLPTGMTVASQQAIQGTYDTTTGIWTLGNLRDNLTRTLNLTVEGTGSGDVTAELVRVNETDPDSTPGDGEGDDFVTLPLALGPPVNINGTPDHDSLQGGNGDEEIDGMGGNDTIAGGGGNDTITGGEGRDVFIDTPANHFGNTMVDLSEQDALIFRQVSLTRSDFTLERSPARLSVDIDGDDNADGTVTFTNDLRGGDFMAAKAGAATRVTFETFLPDLGEGKSVSSDAINGVSNQLFLTGDGVTDFKLTTDARSTAAIHNALGVYEVDTTGDIVDVRILVEDMISDDGTPLDITDVEAGNKLGFFIAQGKTAQIGDLLDETDTFRFVSDMGAAANIADGSDISLEVNGSVIDVTTYHSLRADLNSDGVQHALSGVSVGGEALNIGFEDLMGGGDMDYQDVLFQISIL
ncbi:DUF4114 domain-containing protein [uncultured Sulfitobacter sp.]|uniref:DUF4114 domain-containing protein n=1 Tax=uncultured Sulfitobacter sp. TaxID=191468 RepID=UPI0026240DAC|nr:DUF4114 domain-containing protein [uncultured Sulfitobacter sp.]